jgi:membrane-associated protein
MKARKANAAVGAQPSADVALDPDVFDRKPEA